MFKRLKKYFTKTKQNKKRDDTKKAEDIEVLYKQPVMTEDERVDTFKPSLVLNLSRIYVYTVAQDPHRLLLTPVVYKLNKLNGKKTISLDSRTVALVPEAYTFDDENTADTLISNLLGNIQSGTLPATLDKNDAIRTVNELNAERLHNQKKYNVRAMEQQVFNYQTLQDVVDAFTENTGPDYGVVTSTSNKN